ncbi:MAG: hypothetical protein KBD32_03255 [Burkholderiales bacterium]|nr:hypothetical protein [Burkholderiales bacterium]
MFLVRNILGMFLTRTATNIVGDILMLLPLGWLHSAMLRVNHPAERWVINLLGSVEFDARGFSCSWFFFDFWFYFLLTFLGVLDGTSQHSINGGLV